MDIVMLFVSRDDLLAQLKTLPASPVLLARLLALLDDPNSGLDGLARLIRLERALAARLLTVANSAVYAGAGPCESIEEALPRVGFEPAYRLAATLLGADVVARALPAYQCAAMEVARQAVATACAARRLAHLVNEDANRAYLLGLLHNVGMVVLDRLLRQKAPGTVLWRTPGGSGWTEAERRIFGFDHADAGAEMLQAWNFPAPLVRALRYQFRPEAAAREERLAAILQAARWVADASGAREASPVRLVTHWGCPAADLAALPALVTEETERLWAEWGLAETAVERVA